MKLHLLVFFLLYINSLSAQKISLEIVNSDSGTIEINILNNTSDTLYQMGDSIYNVGSFEFSISINNRITGYDIDPIYTENNVFHMKYNLIKPHSFITFDTFNVNDYKDLIEPIEVQAFLDFRGKKIYSNKLQVLYK